MNKWMIRNEWKLEINFLLPRKKLHGKFNNKTYPEGDLISRKNERISVINCIFGCKTAIKPGNNCFQYKCFWGRYEKFIIAGRPRKDGWKNGRTDGQKEWWMDGRMKSWLGCWLIQSTSFLIIRIHPTIHHSFSIKKISPLSPNDMIRSKYDLFATSDKQQYLENVERWTYIFSKIHK